MKTNKFAILLVGPLTLISLIVSIVLYVNRQAFESFEFVSNLFSGVFASGLLALILAVIGYFEERRKTLATFYSYAQKAVSNFNRYEKSDDIEQTINTILLMNEFDYTELDNAYADISFLINDKSLRDYIFNSIYAPIKDLEGLICEKSYHFKLYKKQLEKDRQHTRGEDTMKKFIEEIDDAIMRRNVQELPDDDGTVFSIPWSENKIVNALRGELSGKYYDIIYPWKKKEEVSTNAH